MSCGIREWRGVRPSVDAGKGAAFCARGAHFSDRGHPFHADRGHRFTLMADGVQRVRVTEFIVSQVSAMAVKPTVLSTPARSAGVGNSAPKAMFG